MLAAKNHMTIPKKSSREPNEETVEALQESRKNKLKSYENLGDFWISMGIDPNAKQKNNKI